MNPDVFYICLNEWLDSDSGEGQDDNILFTDEKNKLKRRIKGFRFTQQMKQVRWTAYDGPKVLRDIRRIEKETGLPGTYSYAQDFLDYEQYVTFLYETILSCGLSIVAVLFVIMFITASVPVTMLVALSVLMVDLFLVALIYYWNLTFNSLVVINIVIAIGLSVDYSAHIAHSYLTIRPPASCVTKAQKRHYKARKALSQMGSSVFHGGFSTFLAIVALAPSKSYIFKVFFRSWFGIIVFGMANGFMLLPVILTIGGPADNLIDEHVYVAEDPKSKRRQPKVTAEERTLNKKN